MYPRLFRKLRCAFVLLLSLFAVTAMADSSRSKVVDGVTIYLGIVPAEIMRGHPKEHPEGTMHGGVSRGGEQYHVMVALFDAKTGQRIDDAEIKAKVSASFFGGEEKKLESMNIADTITYGNYFQMSGHGPFRISLQIRRPNAARVVEAQFEHKHQ